MNKIEKFLYGGFIVVAIAGIVAMLVFVFSPPKQTAGETTETPQPALERPDGNDSAHTPTPGPQLRAPAPRLRSIGAHFGS